MRTQAPTPDVILAGVTLAGFLGLVGAFIFHPVQMDDKESAIVGGMAVALGNRLRQAFDAIWPEARGRTPHGGTGAGEGDAGGRSSGGRPPAIVAGPEPGRPGQG